MAVVFWGLEGILLVDYVPHKTTFGEDVDATMLCNLKEVIREKGRGKLTRGVLLLHSKAPVHKSREAFAVRRDRGFEELNHPAYLPPEERKERHDEGTGAISQRFLEQDKDLYIPGISPLPAKWRKCVGLKGDCTQKGWKHIDILLDG